MSSANTTQVKTLINQSPNVIDEPQITYDSPFLFIYPRHANRTALLAHIIEKNNVVVHYYALTNKDITTEKFLLNFSHDPQFPANFGDNIREALKNPYQPSVWAEAFAHELGKLHSKRYMLILDQVDRIQYLDSFYEFFSVFAQHQPDNVQIVINGRELYRHPWNDIIQNNQGRVIGDTGALGGGIFKDPTDVGQIEFYSIAGNTRVISDGYTVESWDGALPRNLCYYFIEHQRVTRQEIFTTFWPHLGIKEATNVFHVTKRKISEKLGYEITNYSSGFYVPAPKVNVYYDAHEFERAYETAMSGAALVSASHWYKAVHLYRHPYLPEVDMPWANAKREKLSSYYVQALIELGRYNEQNNNDETALGYYLRAVHEKPEREDVHRNIMQIYHRHGRKKELAEQYKMLERSLKRQFNLSPAKETRSLYETLIAN